MDFDLNPVEFKAFVFFAGCIVATIVGSVIVALRQDAKRKKR